MSPSKPRRSPKPQERQRDPDRTRKRILDAAAAEFAAHGYAGARISAIAARAGVNQQLISYYFDGKEGLYQAISQHWRQRESELAPPGMPLPEQIHQYALEALNNPDGVRLMAWSGLEYTGPETDPDHAPRAERLQRSIDEISALQAAGRLPAEVDPACLTVMLMAAAMATTTLPHVIEGVCQVDPRSPEFVHHYADQLTILTRILGLGPA
ncbi:DNA-binding transcriptional regulator, AcrR family [Thermomonospora echinospora]|uniref:DNA-binding transcriptional regulator, AcrR family n=1 Tax=Thermomonospora echinospora TaxID=1992 RepID=A0A1H6DD89_9ACTN|nr:TetR family transcriptional regulator [Thermomonospora echinospora]SEG82685.1 DNA-binding transcriptional regulator, AcrR family [Thermomonospora echinospora]